METPEPTQVKKCELCREPLPKHRSGCPVLEEKQLQSDLKQARKFLERHDLYFEWLSERQIVHMIVMERLARKGVVAAQKEFRDSALTLMEAAREEAERGGKKAEASQQRHPGLGVRKARRKPRGTEAGAGAGKAAGGMVDGPVEVGDGSGYGRDTGGGDEG